ncbi:MAG TPA: alcohol dehydrogenase catalytic domain-containing protein [Actinomycetota bacterium]|nr:alcohol dehydrogenase catalytic domain-containing protein [Actinomycetota bacterium]
MRAWLLSGTRGPDGYHLGSVADPEPGDSEVRVRLHASALNHLDLWVAHGMPAPPAFPHVPGADGAGEIDAVGEGVTTVALGDEVMIDPSTSCGSCAACARGDVPFCRSFRVLGEHRWGTHAEAVVVPVANVVPKPPNVTWEQAAAAGLVVASAVRMLRRARVTAGDHVLVVGVGGGSATAAFLVARAYGATVVATSTKDDGRTWAGAHGAAATFDSAGSYDEEVRAAVGGGVDVVVDNVGSATFERSLRSLRRGGRLVTNGSTSGRTAELHLPTLFWRQLEIVGASMNDHREFAEAVRLLGDGSVEVPVDAAVPFEGFPDALERLEAGDQLGKIVLTR